MPAQPARRARWSSFAGWPPSRRSGRDRRFLLYLWGSMIFQLGNLMLTSRSSERLCRPSSSSNYTQCVFPLPMLLAQHIRP